MATQYATHRLNEVGSTQDEARIRFVDAGPVLVIAGIQTHGRGRSGAAWVHAPRASAASLALRPEWPDGRLGLIPLLAGMAARSVVGTIFGTALRLKWPNDLMLGHSKVGGVLVEMAGGVLVAGCGINVWWPDAPEGMGAVVGEDPGPDVASRLAEAWGAALAAVIDAGPDAWDRTAYLAACDTVGREIEWDPDGRGRAVDVAADGGLVVVMEAGTVTLRSGAVRTVRPR
jgi:BirA family biotin operon repressor/biotin-[acetyl-CoA-carboxylase] ligase